MVEDKSGELNKYYYKLGQHYAGLGEYKMAEKFFLAGSLQKHAIEMYNSAGKWEQVTEIIEYRGSMYRVLYCSTS